MGKQQANGQDKVLGYVGSALAATARAVGRQKSAQKRFAAVAAGLQGWQPRLSALHPRASAALTDGAALAAQQVAAALAALRREKHSAARFAAAADLAGGLDRLGAMLVEMADSLAPGGCCAATGDAKAQRLVDDVARFQQQAGEVAFGFHQAGTQVGEAIGLVTPLSGRSFRFPGAAQSRCGASGDVPVPMSVADWAAQCAPGDARARQPGIDEAALAEALYGIDGLTGPLATLLGALSVLVIVLFIVNCPQLCGPPDNAYIGPAAAPGLPRVAAVGATAVGNFVQPWFDVNWRYCCLRRCLLVLSRTCVQSVTTRHNVGGLIRASVAAGTALAARRGAASVAAYVALAPAVGGIAPPVALPPPPVCTC